VSFFWGKFKLSLPTLKIKNEKIKWNSMELILGFGANSLNYHAIESRGSGGFGFNQNILCLPIFYLIDQVIPLEVKI
jgi:hypothetical protein